jgi:TM2 domain-containing membrane protein YozV
MSEPQRPLNTVHAFCSLLLPGLGQLCQRRIATAIGFFLLFILTGVIPMAIVYTLIAKQYPKFSLWELLPVFFFFDVLCVFVLLVMFCAALDVAVWKPGDRTRFKDPMTMVAIIYIVGFLLLLFSTVDPFSRAPQAARRMQCTNNMKQIVLALHSYHDMHDRLPPAYTVDEHGKPLHSWRVLILPYIEEKTLYEQIRLDEPWDSEHNRQFHSKAPRLFQCPSYPRDTFPVPGGCSYSVVCGTEAAFNGSQSREMKDFAGRLSDTIFLVERKIPVNWMNPTNEITFGVACEGINVDPTGISSFHPGKACCTFGDTGVRFLSDDTDGKTLRAMLTFNAESEE